MITGKEKMAIPKYSVGDIVFTSEDGSVNKISAKDISVNQNSIGMITSSSPLCTVAINGMTGSSGAAGSGSISGAGGSGGFNSWSTTSNSSCSSMSSSSSRNAYPPNCYTSRELFLANIVSNTLRDGFYFTNECLIDIVEEIMENASTRSFISRHMPILMLKSNNVGVFILNAVVSKIEEDSE